MLIKYQNFLKNLLTFIMCFLLLLSCSKANINTSYNIESGKRTGLIFKVSENDNNRGVFSVNLNFNDFSLKSNTNGQEKKVKSDISLIRVYLVDSNSSTLSDSNIKFGPLDLTSSNTGSLLTFFNNVKGTSGSSSLRFTNVGQGTYYVAVAAFDDTSGLDSTKNLSNTSSSTSGAYTTITASSTNFGRFALSTSGGDSNGGSVEVGGYSVHYSLVNGGTNPLNVNLALKSGIGATLDATTTITEGNTTIPATTLL